MSMFKARSEFKSLVRNVGIIANTKFKRRNHISELYWNMLKEASDTKTVNMAMSTSEQYFKAINNSTNPFYTHERYENDEFDMMFVYVDVLRPSQPSGVMSSAVSLPNHTFTG